MGGKFQSESIHQFMNEYFQIYSSNQNGSEIRDILEKWRRVDLNITICNCKECPISYYKYIAPLREKQRFCPKYNMQYSEAWVYCANKNIARDPITFAEFFLHERGTKLFDYQNILLKMIISDKYKNLYYRNRRIK